VKIRRVIRRTNADGTSAMNAVVAATIGESGGVSATSVQHAEIVQRSRKRPESDDPTDKE
jgi:hypothetical protein